jgi:hypothetical protein
MAWSSGGVNALNLIGEVSCGGKGQGESDSSIFLPISIVSLVPFKAHDALYYYLMATSLSFICVIASKFGVPSRPRTTTPEQGRHRESHSGLLS